MINAANTNLILASLPFVTFVTLFILQTVFPRRNEVKLGSRRQWHNLFLFIINVLLMALLPLTLIATAFWAEHKGIGLLNVLNLPSWLSLILSVVVLDMMIYWQHRAMHSFNWLWRMHKVHHTDLSFDVTTAVRFHALELGLSQVYKALCVLILGAPVLAIIVFELLLLLGAQFSHSNWNIKNNIDQFLRTIIVTPDVHRIHHSVFRHEHDTNYGFFLIVWDKLFGTYTQLPEDGQQQMQIGLANEQQKDRVELLTSLLVMPFVDHNNNH